ncbi:uncharacterized protein I303_104140 [Kwoniella dejecticola CBS 10117]|uniref:monoamine oxidase n=1 Tax=Kwoniella dejecticola CBS 10117 TaxID=1296121 RepID=A0A1A6A666_9TREE|nr:uncharacterized protein I303_04881 [Kwoniella dejecticola CBS 10117]OBR85545.1 hypothetical protein I303_04881 [Kwoniella dejecticola CBS 10117]
MGTRAATPLLDTFDLGAAWIWPSMQPELARLTVDLGISTFDQYETGDVMVESSALEAPRRIQQHMSGDNGWVRIVNGMGSLVSACSSQLDKSKIKLNEVVKEISYIGRDKSFGSSDLILISTENRNGQRRIHRAKTVILALPPRLVADSIKFDPPLPETTMHEYKATPTWMANAAKYLAVYEKPFWREQGLSGDVFSRVGPMAEIHDATSHDGSAALVGFLATKRQPGVPNQPELMNACREQLGRIFGKDALKTEGEVIKDWSTEVFTATPDDRVQSRGHATSSPPISPVDGVWAGQLVGVSSEWSPVHPGFIAGAVDAANRGYQEIQRSYTRTLGSDT